MLKYNLIFEQNRPAIQLMTTIVENTLILTIKKKKLSNEVHDVYIMYIHQMILQA